MPSPLQPVENINITLKNAASIMSLMKYLILLGIILLLTECSTSENKDSKRLQIGIKKRPRNCGDKSKKGDLLHVHYKGTFENGTEFDTSYLRQIPFTFTVGSGQVIKGWDQGLIGMCIGELRKLVIPPELGYGEYGVPPTIAGDSTLIFHIELMKIEKKNDQQI